MKTVVILQRVLLMFFALYTFASPAAESTAGYYVYFKKPADWQKVYLYSWHLEGSASKETSGPWPGRSLSAVGGWYRGFIETGVRANGSRLIFNSGSGQQTPDLGRDTNGWYVWKDQGKLVDRWYDVNPEDRAFTLTVSGGKGAGQYNAGSLVTIEADARPQAPFTRWESSQLALLKDPTQAFAQFQMPDSDVTFKAVFASGSSGGERYASLCVSCHGAEGKGGVGPSLRVADGSCKSCRSEETLIKRISETMPRGAVGTCTGQCAQEIAQYILKDLNESGGVDCNAPLARLGKRQLRLLTRDEYAQTIAQIFGLQQLDALRFWPETGLVQGYNNNAEASVASDRHVLVFAKAAQEIVAKKPIDAVWGASCAGAIDCQIQAAGLQLFHGPLTAEELASYRQLWKSSPEPEQTVLALMLQSPRFLYRSELGTFVAPMNAYSLSAYETATALAYGLTGGPPDAALLAKAADGSIKQAATRREEALRLLQSKQARIQFASFAEQWLGTSSLPFLTRDQGDFTARIRADMLEETRRFVGDLVFEQKAGVAELYRSDRSFLSQALARYYKLPVPGSDWEPQRGARRGILAQGSVLASYANSQEASPIKRGVFVRNRLLCQDLPPPPANVDTTIPPPSPGLTIRERLARHISQGDKADGSNSCFSCHQYIDKVGFGFESFDETAKFRSFYKEKPNVPIDVSGEVKSLETLADTRTISFQNLDELSDVLAQSARVKECFASQYFRFAHGRVESREDQCVLQQVQRGLRDEGSILNFIADLVADESFINRR